MPLSKHKPAVPAALLAALLLSACTSPPEHQESGIDVPGLWSRLPAAAPLAGNTDAAIDQAWWRTFHDPVLDALIGEALENNQTLQIAKARVEEAQAARGFARSSLAPQIAAVGGAQRGNQGYATGNKVVGVAEGDLQATWELDLFGRNQARVAEAGAILESEEASRQGVRVSLLAQVARTYFDLRDAHRQVELTRRNLETQKRTVEIILAQQQGALVSDFDVQRASAQVSATEALIPSLEAAEDVALDRLNVLLGHPPGSRYLVGAELSELSPLDQRILVAAPARVLAARPDVRAAERRFAASLSAKDAATAELFPDISLAALFGAQASTPFTATVWNAGGNLVLPILNFGRIESQIDAADARQKQAYLGYRQTVLEALEDMENALSRYGHESSRNASLAAGVAQNQRAAELARQQYTNGYTGLLDVLVAERNLLDAEAAQASSDATLRRDLVDIYAAAGGGWEDEHVPAQTSATQL